MWRLIRVVSALGVVLVVRAMAETPGDVPPIVIDRATLALLLGALSYMAKVVHTIVSQWKNPPIIMSGGNPSEIGALLRLLEQHEQREIQFHEVISALLAKNQETMTVIQTWQTVQTRALEKQMEVATEILTHVSHRRTI